MEVGARLVVGRHRPTTHAAGAALVGPQQAGVAPAVQRVLLVEGGRDRREERRHGCEEPQRQKDARHTAVHSDGIARKLRACPPAKFEQR